MIQVIIVTPGSTDFDEQHRIVGNLDIPLNSVGADQAARVANELSGRDVKIVYSTPSKASVETAQTLAQRLNAKFKTLPLMRNLDHGLWQGKLIREVKETQRKVYRKWREQPETVCPPEGETLPLAQQRVAQSVDKLLKKHKSGTVVLVVPEPLAGLVQCHLTKQPLAERWQVESVCGSWQMIDVDRVGDSFRGLAVERFAGASQ